MSAFVRLLGSTSLLVSALFSMDEEERVYGDATNEFETCVLAEDFMKIDV